MLIQYQFQLQSLKYHCLQIILFYALVYNDDDDEDAGLSSGVGTNLKVGGTCQREAPEIFLSCPSTFLALQVQSVVLVSASVWSVQFDHFLVFCSSYSLCPRALSFVKVGHVPPCPGWSQRHFHVSFTPESIIKKPFNLNAQRHKDYFPIVCVQITHRVILLTRFCKLLTRVATPSGGDVPQVPQWHDASERRHVYCL